MDFLPRKYFRVEYVTIVNKGVPDSDLYWIDVSTRYVDGHEVSVDDRFTMAKFSFISNHLKVEEESAFYATNGNILYLFDSEDTAFAYAYARLKATADEEESLRWIEILKKFA